MTDTEEVEVYRAFMLDLWEVLRSAGYPVAPSQDGPTLLDFVRAAVLPAWTCRDREGRYYRIVHPDQVHLDPRAPLDEAPPLARCIRVTDSAGNPLPLPRP